MANVFAASRRLATLAAPALVLAGVAMAQAPDQQKIRQPTLPAVQQQDDVRSNTDQSRTEADRKVREMDRRLNRVLHSICTGC